MGHNRPPTARVSPLLLGTLEQHLFTLFSMPYPIIPYNPKLKERARQLRKNMTAGERKLWQHLKGKQMMGYDFDRQRPIDQFIVDFYCKSLMLAIEIDGSSHDSAEAQERDRIRQSRIESFGVQFLRFQDREVLHQTDQVLTAIQQWIESRCSKVEQNPPPAPPQRGVD
ncbi:MAG: endonuclease domain-containing protein [Leptolyngbyaceae bacterium]|nr:endonuclease domain-containing protein [Leptolyngbyaceae bacterium]